MKNILLYIHQLPQNIIGLLVICFTHSKYDRYFGCYNTYKYSFGVSLGKYIIFGGRPTPTDIKHEQGHQRQSLYLGWLYLLIIGLPSVCGNLWDRLFHKKWTNQKRIDWYYNRLLWEHWADKLGGVER